MGQERLFRAAMILPAEQDCLLGAQEELKSGVLDPFHPQSPGNSY